VYGLAAVLTVMLFLLPALTSANTQLHDKRILLINSYDPLFPTYARRIEGLNAVFRNTGAHIDIEFMDSKRHFDNETQKRYLSLLEQKLLNRPKYDVVITSDDNALKLVLAYRDSLFFDIPIVFNGLNDESLAKEMKGYPQVTGVVESVSAQGNLALISSIDPSRNKLHVIVDSTPSGQADLKRILKAHHIDPTLELYIIDLSTLSWDKYAHAIARLGDKDAILLLSAFRDKNLKSKLFEESIGFLTQHAKVPIYHMWEHGLGQGIFGGILINQFDQAYQSALMAKAILQGTPVNDIPVLIESTNHPMFDYNQLSRFGVTANHLPADANIMYKPLTMWESYRYELSLFIGAVMLLMMIAIYLARESFLRTRLAKEAEKQSNFLRSVMDTVPDLIWIKDTQGKYLSCNKRVEQLFGAHEKDILGKTDFDFVSPELAQIFRQNDELAIQRNGPSRNEERVTFKSDGHEELLETIKTPLRAFNGDLIGVLGISRNITERTAAEARIKTLLQAIEQSPVSVVICDENGDIEYVNHRFQTSSGYSLDEVVGNKANFLNPQQSLSDNYESMWEALQQQHSWEGELSCRHKSGAIFWEYAYVSPIQSDEGSVTGYLFVKEDITLRRQQEEKIRFQAHFDALTGLPNRVLSQDRLQQMINGAQRNDTSVGILYIDLDDFKKVNDTLGHNTGDQLLIEVSKRFSAHIREGDTLGRLGGDEFILLINDMKDVTGGSHVASHLINELEKPILLDGRQILVSASIGITLYPNDGLLPGDLMRKADLAMYHAKQIGGSRCSFYTSELNETVERRFIVEQQLRSALEHQEFHLVYQPKVRISTGKVMGFEVLIRWDNPSLGTISPVEFIPIAEQTGAIVAIGHFIIDTALQVLKPLCETLQHDFLMSINLSPRQFRDEELSTTIISLIDKHGIDPHKVEFEITEGLFIEDLPGVKETLTHLHEQGIKLAMDDFGTGYSSLSYLRHYPFDTLKIDREFIRSVNVNEADQALVNATVSMAHNLGLEVVAEGVETPEQQATLETLSCDIVQGYLYSKPVSATELEKVIAQINQ
jgi:diguanylate cyclase (GGDEF)-like protein/PAS domain S-box-containing protein